MMIGLLQVILLQMKTVTFILWEEKVLDGSRFIFISFEQGNGGHRIGRAICCLPDVHWYSHRDNGINRTFITNTQISDKDM